MGFSDFNRINTNIQSLEARFALDKINQELGRTQLRLSTGYRINRAEDDAAGFSLSAKLSARISGLEQALANTGDAKSVLDIAESSFNSIIDILTTMKSKATQAANDTLGTEERAFILSQVTSLATEITALANQTVYQGNTLLTGSYNATFQVGERTSDTIFVRLLSGGSGNAFTAAGLGVSALTVNTNANAQTSMGLIDTAITSVASSVNQLGIYQTQLSIREEILTQAINSNSAARSRIRDADFAKEQSDYIKLQILQQTAIAALSQANLAPESVLGFLR
jgi:flagellin